MTSDFDSRFPDAAPVSIEATRIAYTTAIKGRGEPSPDGLTSLLPQWEDLSESDRDSLAIAMSLATPAAGVTRPGAWTELSARGHMAKLMREDRQIKTGDMNGDYRRVSITCESVGDAVAVTVDAYTAHRDEVARLLRLALDQIERDGLPT